MSEILLGFVGDLLLNRGDPDVPFSAVKDLLSAPGYLFGNMEGAYTDHPQPVPSAPEFVYGPSHCLEAFPRHGFSALSLANNHILDVGIEAMLENRERLQSRGVRTCGAGADVEDAHAPAIVKVEGMRIACLAYASIFPIGFEARHGRPGLAPLRAYNHWREPFQHLLTPGMRPYATTIPDARDLEALAADISKARGKCDVLITSFHWGDHTRAHHLTDHEIRTARLCIDLGADIVVGHHHHAIRGMEWYSGRPIFYGLGHFIFDLPWENVTLPPLTANDPLKLYFDQIGFEIGPRPDWPWLPMHPDTRMTLFAWAKWNGKAFSEIGFVPCELRQDGSVAPVEPDSMRGREIRSYVERAVEIMHLNGKIIPGEGFKVGGCASLKVIPLHDSDTIA